MLSFIIRRLVITIPMVLIVISLTWGLIRFAPGNFYTAERRVTAAVAKNLDEKYGRNKPLYVQYGKMIWNIVRFDFGTSLKYEGQSVNQILVRTLPVSVTVGLLAYLLALIVGVVAGTLAALKQNSRLDYASMALAMLGISLPNFVLGPLLVLVFSLSLFWLPPARWADFPSRNIILPVITLSAIYMAYIARLTRSGMLEVLRADYIRTARAKGLKERNVMIRHALRGGLLAGRVVHRPGARVSDCGNGGRRTNLRAARSRQLFHQRQSQSRRTAHHRHRRVYFDCCSAIQSRG